jgi:hypothetical protein
MLTPLEKDGDLIFPVLSTENEQIEAIQTAEPPVITQDDIDNAILEWNGDKNSISRVVEYMRENARARDTAKFLFAEYDAGRTIKIQT